MVRHGRQQGGTQGLVQVAHGVKGMAIGEKYLRYATSPLAVVSAYGYSHLMASTTDSIAAEVRAELARRRCPAKDVAAALGLDKSAVSRRLNGHTRFTVEDLAIIGRLLGVEPGRFLSADHGDPVVGAVSTYADKS